MTVTDPIRVDADRVEKSLEPGAGVRYVGFLIGEDGGISRKEGYYWPDNPDNRPELAAPDFLADLIDEDKLKKKTGKTWLEHFSRDSLRPNPEQDVTANG